ncbi:hypothetical protein MMC17_009699 [Xylographa soralifera]|nr:hypothetical protein [Xylographa soralifera]
MVLDNDTRGWIMTSVSGIACVFGASIICVDLIIQYLPGKRNFRIQDSNAFLSSSLSLSFGVMLFSALYGMLPSAKNYLVKGGYSPQEAAYILIGSFLAGVIGIQIVSRVLHHYIPSHIVDCDHTHEENDEGGGEAESNEEDHHQNGHAASLGASPNSHDEYTPLLDPYNTHKKTKGIGRPRSATTETTLRPGAPFVTTPASRRPSLQTRLTNRVSTFVSGAKALCDEGGPCYGYSDPCGKECLKAMSRSPTRFYKDSINASGRPTGIRRASTHPLSQNMGNTLGALDEEHDMASHTSCDHEHRPHTAFQQDRGRQGDQRKSSFRDSKVPRAVSNGDLESGNRSRGQSSASQANPPNDPAQAHHHHVPSNAFLSIGLQTSIAIALHKLPEGFITYATNHANPKLGFAVFIALFIHNITEGFAMALPLYLALGSRWKAMLWSSLLGGLSQPLGAGVAALWFKLSQNTDMAPGERVYGGMFAVTAGIMASVALQLFSESLGLTHNKNLCITFAFIGMGILGVSFALTAD